MRSRSVCSVYSAASTPIRWGAEGGPWAAQRECGSLSGVGGGWGWRKIPVGGAASSSFSRRRAGVERGGGGCRLARGRTCERAHARVWGRKERPAAHVSWEVGMRGRRRACSSASSTRGRGAPGPRARASRRGEGGGGRRRREKVEGRGPAGRVWVCGCGSAGGGGALFRDSRESQNVGSRALTSARPCDALRVMHGPLLHPLGRLSTANAYRCGDCWLFPSSAFSSTKTFTRSLGTRPSASARPAPSPSHRSLRRGYVCIRASASTRRVGAHQDSVTCTTRNGGGDHFLRAQIHFPCRHS